VPPRVIVTIPMSRIIAGRRKRQPDETSLKAVCAVTMIDRSTDDVSRYVAIQEPCDHSLPSCCGVVQAPQLKRIKSESTVTGPAITVTPIAPAPAAANGGHCHRATPPEDKHSPGRVYSKPPGRAID
jgi:hypothetical protein